MALSRSTRWMLLLLVPALALGAAWASRHLREPAAAPGTNTPAAAASKLTPAPTAMGPLELLDTDLVTVSLRTMQPGLEVSGTIRARDQAVVRTKVAGELLEVLVREGETVRQGQLLARIDPVEFEWRVREREAQWQGARAQYELARKQRENNAQLLARGFISQTAFDNSQSSMQVSESNRDAAEAQLTLARKALADTRILAPIGGQVAERSAQPGEKLAVDGKVLSLIDLSHPEFEAAVPAADVSRVKTGQVVEVRVEGKGDVVRGRVVRINPGTQAGSRSVLVYVALQTDGVTTPLRAGLFAQGRLLLEQREPVLAVPLAALHGTAAERRVYVIEQGQLRERPVQTGLLDAQGSGWVEITAGLAAGEQVVRADLGRLRTDVPVEIIRRAQ